MSTMNNSMNEIKPNTSADSMNRNIIRCPTTGADVNFLRIENYGIYVHKSLEKETPERAPENTNRVRTPLKPGAVMDNELNDLDKIEEPYY